MIVNRILYVLAAIAVVPVSFAHLFGPVESDGVRRTYDRNIYRLAGAGFTVDEIAVVLVYVLVGLLLIAGLWAPRTVAPQLAIVVLCVVAAVLLLVKPDTSDPKPPLSAGGTTLLVLAIVVALVAAADAARQLSSRRSSRGSARPAPATMAG